MTSAQMFKENLSWIQFSGSLEITSCSLSKYYISFKYKFVTKMRFLKSIQMIPPAKLKEGRFSQKSLSSKYGNSSHDYFQRQFFSKVMFHRSILEAQLLIKALQRV